MLLKAGLPHLWLLIIWLSFLTSVLIGMPLWWEKKQYFNGCYNRKCLLWGFSVTLSSASLSSSWTAADLELGVLMGNATLLSAAPGISWLRADRGALLCSRGDVTSPMGCNSRGGPEEIKERLFFFPSNVTFPKGNLWFKDAPQSLCVVGWFYLLK